MIFCDLRFFTEDAKVEHKVFTDRQYHMSCKIDKAKDSTKEFSSNLFLPPQLNKFRKPPPTRRLFDAKKEARSSGLPERGASRNRTGDKGFADPCLTAWLRRRMEKRYKTHQ
jgi:hypothetical protein